MVPAALPLVPLLCRRRERSCFVSSQQGCLKGLVYSWVAENIPYDSLCALCSFSVNWAFGILTPREGKMRKNSELIAEFGQNNYSFPGGGNQRSFTFISFS